MCHAQAVVWSPLPIDLAGPLIVACSGGADSVALAAWIAAEHRAGRAGPPTLAYVDHQLRPDSATDGDRVRALGDRLGLPVRVLEVTVDRGASLERAARDARHAALGALADELGARIVLGHTASDQAETVLLRLLRGTGVAGLAGMAPVSGRLLRPLLGCWRADTEAYCRERQIPTSEDPMNADERFARVRVRRRWLPALREENPSLDAALCRLADAAREQRELLELAARALLPAAGEPLETPVLAAAPAAAGKRALALAAEGAGLGLEASHLEALWALCRAPAAGTVTLDLPGGRALRCYDRLRFESGATPEAAAPAPLEVSGPDGPYALRRWQPGDRMRPERLRGRSRKLSDLFTDARVPREQRTSARVVVRERDGAIVWAEHLGPAHGAGVEVRLTARKPATTNGN